MNKKKSPPLLEFETLVNVFSILLIFIGLAICFSLAGCATPPKQLVVTKIKYVNVPVKCEIPKIECDFSGDGISPLQKLLKCVILQKKVIDACSKQIG